MLIQFLLLGFGFMIVNRTIKNQINRKTLSEANLQRIKKAHTTFFGLLTILSPWLPPTFVALSIIFLQFLISRAEKIINFILRHNFQQEWLQTLDELILMMMIGRSFRDSFLQITSHHKNPLIIQLREALLISGWQRNLKPSSHSKNNFLLSSINSISSSRSLSTSLRFVDQLVQSIENNPHKAIDKLKSHRQQLHWEIQFKKKSQQITLLMRIQATTLCLLYIGLLAFMLTQESSSQLIILKNSTLMGSLTLFLLGILHLIYIGRKKSWKT